MEEATQTAGTAPECTPGFPSLPARVRLALEVAAVVAVWAGTVVVLTAITIEHPVLHNVAHLGHLVSLAVGFGGVVVVDTYGLLWLAGRRSAAEVGRLAMTGHWLVLGGLTGLLVTGAMLHPDLSRLLPRIKMLLVLVVMLNGLNAHRLGRRLPGLPPHVRGGDIPWWFVPRGLVSALVSQVGWWGAIAIGFATSAARAGN